jgi:hypothetical protein
MLVIGWGITVTIIMVAGMQWQIRRNLIVPAYPLPVQLILTTVATAGLLLNGLKAANLAMGAGPSIHALLRRITDIV